MTAGWVVGDCLEVECEDEHADVVRRHLHVLAKLEQTLDLDGILAGLCADQVRGDALLPYLEHVAG